MPAIRTTTSLLTIVGASVRTTTGLLAAKGLFVRDAGNASRSVLTTYKVSVSPTNVRGSGNSSAPITVSTSSAGVTVTGGTAPFTYNWTQLSGGSGWAANYPTSSSTAFRKTLVGSGADYTSTWKCTVTDASGSSLDTATVTAQVINLYGA